MHSCLHMCLVCVQSFLHICILCVCIHTCAHVSLLTFRPAHMCLVYVHSNPHACVLCACIHTCAHVFCVCVASCLCTCIYGNQKLVLGVFRACFRSYFLIHGLSMRLELTIVLGSTDCPAIPGFNLSPCPVLRL